MRQLLTCKNGTTAIEFAIVLPILLLMFYGTVQFGYIIFESAVLEGALSAAAREGKIGYPDITDPGSQCVGGACKTDKDGNILNIGPRWRLVQASLQAQTRSIMDPAKLIFTATSYPDFDTLQRVLNGDTSVSGTGSHLGKSAQVVVYTATYPCPTLFQSLLGLGKTGNITAYNIVRNEGF